MKHEVKDEKAGSGFVNDVEKGDDFVATDAETVKVDEANDEEGKLTFTRPSGFKGGGACLKVILPTTGLCKTKWFLRRTLLMIIKLQNLGSRLYLVILFRLPRVVFGWEGSGNEGLVRSETFEPEELLPLKSQSKRVELHSELDTFGLSPSALSCVPAFLYPT
ncbi:hypothetical protein NC651_000196 [Populus alba x Populus x berolinensis]|nr:hypothetical protein NC651_000196 [Populus alba x Populus x berolinensis]